MNSDRRSYWRVYRAWGCYGYGIYGAMTGRNRGAPVFAPEHAVRSGRDSDGTRQADSHDANSPKLLSAI
jgi:hypothetical protein